MSGPPGTGRLIAQRYRLIGPLGEGRTGVVWLARDELLGREVAVKEVRAPAGIDATATRELYGRLERAARTAGRVSHRNVVAVHDVATDDGRPWIVMELVRGIALSDVLEAEGPMPPARAAHLGAEAVAALRAAHAVGVVHHDVRAANVLIANDGRVMLTGFAAAASASQSVPAGEPGTDADLWSLGALLYTTVEGRTPGADGEIRPSERAGALAPVISGLLRRDAAERMPAEEAEHRLRLASAGGAPRATAATPSGPSASRSGSDGDAPAGGAGRSGGAPTSAVDAPARHADGGPSAFADEPRRAAAVLVAGVVALLVAVAALVWAVLAG
ncbi:serine/threonine protein kinase [Streptomyces sp. ISL-10]|uniref:serine/threonine-protein kinase n=1 Tax=Streptomyces sp. ISL-10 TaxID=2819172 RepID=UPI001BE52D30|nr:serine/threonine-protein kinase [Streptomyces sp. ISL-10]MBT2369617.1 serine/threonine protein kinase [Streptomyces sp. ISL-10]